VLHQIQACGCTSLDAERSLLLLAAFAAMLALEAKAVAQSVLAIWRQTVGGVDPSGDSRTRETSASSVGHVRAQTRCVSLWLILTHPYWSAEGSQGGLQCTTSLPWRLRIECEVATPSLLHAQRCRPRNPTRWAASPATAPAHGRRPWCTPVRPRVCDVTSATPGDRREHLAHKERYACLTFRALPGRPHVRMSYSTLRLYAS